MHMNLEEVLLNGSSNRVCKSVTQVSYISDSHLQLNFKTSLQPHQHVHLNPFDS